MQKFRCIIADPPWKFNDGLKFSRTKAASANYRTLTVGDIISLPIRDIADPSGCVLALWVPSSFIDVGLHVMESWGFSHKQTYVWEKRTKNGKLAFGMGRLFRQSHELALVGINSTNVYRFLANRSQRSVCIAPNIKHSQKPPALHKSFDLMFPGDAKIELFARRNVDGWMTIGDHVCYGDDIRESLAELIEPSVEFEIELEE